MKKEIQTKFFTYNQNNSGGHFDIDDDRGINECVIIEALDHTHANSRAEEIGLYFDGCESGMDCECCGDRWSAAWGNDGEDMPTYFGTPIEKATTMSAYRASAFIHYLDGTFKKVSIGADSSNAVERSVANAIDKNYRTSTNK